MIVTSGKLGFFGSCSDNYHPQIPLHSKPRRAPIKIAPSTDHHNLHNTTEFHTNSKSKRTVELTNKEYQQVRKGLGPQANGASKHFVDGLRYGFGFRACDM